jgi:glycosyltransferase involved in cell wall biosynthesis
MQNQAKILFIVPFANAEANTFVHSLAEGLKGWDISIKDSGLTTLLFDAGKFDLLHFFLPAQDSPGWRLRKRSNQVIVQTLLTPPQEEGHYKDVLFAQSVITFSEKEYEAIRRSHSNIQTRLILPCNSKTAIQRLEPSADVRERYDVQDRLFAVALNDFDRQEQFVTFLYTAREYQRRGGFRFIIPLYHKNRQSLLWRQRLQTAIIQENLTATTLLDEQVDVHSLLDSADVTLYMDQQPSGSFSFPLIAVEALCSGKPVISYGSNPVGELMSLFRSSWVAKAYEDFSRISRDIQKGSAELEQTSTELARFAQARMSVEAVSEKYNDLYKNI